MARVRLLADVPEGREGQPVTVSSARASELVSRGQAERVIIRSQEIERT